MHNVCIKFHTRDGHVENPFPIFQDWRSITGKSCVNKGRGWVVGELCDSWSDYLRIVATILREAAEGRGNHKGVGGGDEHISNREPLAFLKESTQLLT